MTTLLKNCSLLGLAVAVACGGSSPPIAPAPSLTNITVNGSDLLLIGQSETFTALGNTGAPVTTAWWGTDAPTVVTVEGYTGRITAVGTGTATIFADLGGIRGTKTIRTVPDFTGYWSGLYEQTGCEATGDRAGLRGCPDSEYDFYISEMKMRLTQDRDTVSGTFSLGGGRPETPLVSGRASPDGTLTFTGTAGDSVVNVELQNVRFEVPRKGEMMTGTFELLYSSSTSIRSGTLRVFAKLRTMQGPQ
jgi:hypothetical protein